MAQFLAPLKRTPVCLGLWSSHRLEGILTKILLEVSVSPSVNWSGGPWQSFVIWARDLKGKKEVSKEACSHQVFAFLCIS